MGTFTVNDMFPVQIEERPLRDYQTRSMPMHLVHPYQGGLPRRTQVLADYLVDWFKRSGEALDRL